MVFDIENEWTEPHLLFTQVEECAHLVRFVRYDKIVIALLHIRHCPRLFDPHSLVSPGTEVILSWSTLRVPKDPILFAMDDVLSFPGTDVALVAKNRDVRYFGSDAVKPCDASMVDPLQAKAQFKLNSASYHRRIDAISIIWDPYST